MQRYEEKKRMSNMLRPYKEVAFFLTVKAPAKEMTEVDVDVVKSRLRLLCKPQTESMFNRQHAEEDIDAFYQCMAVLASNAPSCGWWMEKEKCYLAYKLQCYWAHLKPICKAEDVELRMTKKTCTLKLPWQLQEDEFVSPRSIATNVFEALRNNQALIQQRIAKYRVDNATRATVLQWMDDQGMKF